MNTVLPVKAGGAFAYQIVIEDSFDGIIQALEPLDLTERRICIVTDDTVEKLLAGEEVEIDTGTFQSLNDASNFVRTIEERTGMKVSDIEEFSKEV